MGNLIGRAQRVHRIVIAIAIAILLVHSTAVAYSDQQAAQAKPNSETNQNEVRRLELGKPIEREMKGGESHTYEITLEAGQFLHVIVDQRGIDVVARVVAPDGKQLMEVDSPNGSQGPEPVEYICDVSGSYQVQVASLEKNAPAGKYEIKIVALRAATENDRSLQEASKLNQQVEKLKDAGKYDQALPMAERALAIREKALGPEHPDVALSLNNLATLNDRKGDYAKTEPLYQRALAIREKALGPDHPDVALSLNNLGLLYKNKGDYAKAEPLYQRALSIREKALGPDHAYVARSLNNLAVLYKTKGDYAKAEPLYQHALAIFEKALGPDHPDVATSLNNLAELYREKGDYAKAEPLFQRALAIQEKALGPDHPDVALSLDNFAALYSDKGDYAKAEPLYQRALSIREKALGPVHPDVATSLNDLAALYGSKGDYAKAEPLFQRALAISEKALGPDHPDVANWLNNLAALYGNKGDYAKAEPLYQRALSIREKALGPDHPDVATSLDDLAALYRNKGDYTKAEPLFQRALAISEKALGPDHPDVANNLSKLAALYQAKGEVSKAIDYQLRCNDAADRDFTRNLSTGSERQRLLYLNQTAQYVDATLSLHAQAAPDNPKARGAALKVLLQRKGRALDATADVIAALRRHALPEDQRLIDQLAEARARLSRATLAGPGREGIEKHRADLQALEEQVEKLEVELSQRSTEFRVQSMPVTIELVQKRIPAEGALVEYAAYRPFNPKAAKKDEQYGKAHYAAYVLRDQGEALWVELGEAAAIDEKINAFRQALRNKQPTVRRLARSVDKLVMQPVLRLLGPTRRVFLSPDGALSLIPFAALIDERGEYLVKRYSFTYLTTGRDLLRLQNKVQGKSAKMIIADPAFGKEVMAGVNTPTTGMLGEYVFRPLTATREEARDLKRLFPGATVLIGARATETVIKAADRPAILHIATHGFFLRDEQELVATGEGEKTRLAVRRKEPPQGKSVVSQELVNPLMRSGLALAGANERKGGNGEDGILTASEVAGLDLWGTKLVVLSACDTGVGKVVSGDGVYGLRRALVLAGSESQMMSLWPVSDTGTRELMIEYYKRLKAGEGRSEALRRVQLKMLASKNRNHPFYWASFIQSGEWANLDGKRVD